MQAKQLAAALDDINAQLAGQGEPVMLFEEAVGGRLYTGPMHVKYNDLLVAGGPGVPGQHVTSIHVINSCIVKVSKLTAAAVVYRGVAGGLLPNEFWIPNSHNDAAASSPPSCHVLNRQVALDYVSKPWTAGHRSSSRFRWAWWTVALTSARSRSTRMRRRSSSRRSPASR